MTDRVSDMIFTSHISFRHSMKRTYKNLYFEAELTSIFTFCVFRDVREETFSGFYTHVGLRDPCQEWRNLSLAVTEREREGG